MGEGKRKKQKLNTYSELTKKEKAVAKYTRFNTPKKNTVIQKQNVDYFVGSKAIDTLMASTWTKPTKKEPVPLIQNRADAVKFMQKMLVNDKLYRAEKILKESKSTKDDSSNKSEKEDSSGKLRKRKTGKEEPKSKDEKEDEKKKEGDGKKAEEKKKRKKYKLVSHENQIFVDSADTLYVWKYDPMTPKKMFMGIIVVLGIIGVTLFPLWPPSVRVGVYYLSVCGGIFVGSILAIAAGRSILFALIWGVTLGKHHFWFLPNLLADVGFFDSFKPVYIHEVRGEKKDKDKNSDSENDENEKESSAEKDQPPEGVAELQAIEQLSDVQSPQDDAEEASSDEVNTEEGSAKDGDDNSPEGSVKEPMKNGSADERGSTSDYEVIEDPASQ